MEYTLGNSLSPENVRDAYRAQRGYGQVFVSVVGNFFREVKASRGGLFRDASSVRAIFHWKKRTRDYAKMSYAALRRIADNDVLADQMSEEEYERLSIELWRKFRDEKELTEATPVA